MRKAILFEGGEWSGLFLSPDDIEAIPHTAHGDCKWIKMINPDTRWMSVYVILGNSNVAKLSQHNNLPLVMAEEEVKPVENIAWRSDDAEAVHALINDPRTKKL